MLFMFLTALLQLIQDQQKEKKSPGIPGQLKVTAYVPVTITAYPQNIICGYLCMKRLSLPVTGT
jgi:hypothetical protein